MKKSSLSLEVICHRNNQNDEKLVLENNEYKTKPIINRPHLSNEGMLANIENQKVDFFKQMYQNLNLPDDVESYSLVVVKNETYTSKQCSLSKPISRRTIATVGTSLYAYESSSRNIFLVSKEDLNNSLKLFSLLSYEYINKRKTNNDKEQIYREVYDILNESLDKHTTEVNVLKSLNLNR